MAHRAVEPVIPLGVFYFEPIKYIVKLPERISGSTDIPGHTRFGAYYFLEKTLQEYSDDYVSIDLREILSNTLKRSIEGATHYVESQLTSIIPEQGVIRPFLYLTKSILSYSYRRSRFLLRGLTTCFHLHKKLRSILVPLNADERSLSFCVISSNKSNVEQLIAELKKHFEELNEITKDFGLELEKFLEGARYQEYLLNDINARDIDISAPRNLYEENVINVVKSLTSSFLSNVRITFGKGTLTEQFEYDIVISLESSSTAIRSYPFRLREHVEGRTRRLMFEIKDYEECGKNYDSLKADIILKTQDKARLLRASNVAVIIKGLDIEQLNAIRQIAETRKIYVLTEEDYQQRIKALIRNEILYAIGGEYAILQERGIEEM